MKKLCTKISDEYTREVVLKTILFQAILNFKIFIVYELVLYTA